MVRFVEFEETDRFPFPRPQVWSLLQSHREDAEIRRVHPLIRRQATLSRTDEEQIVERTIDVRGRLLTSRWRLIYRPPEFASYEVLESEGPWSVGTRVESQYRELPGATEIASRIRAHVAVVPWFFPQGLLARSVLNQIDEEDRAYLRAGGARGPGASVP